MSSIYKNTQPQVYKVLVGNKVDLDDRVVSKADAEKMALEHGIEYFETSAKEGINIKELMDNTKAKIYEYLFREEHKDGIKPSIVIGGRRQQQQEPQ